MSNKVIIHSDGSANNMTKGAGGYGIHIRNGEVKTYSGGQYINTNSSRMELRGCLAALKKCNKGDEIEIFIDNQYVVNSFRLGWIFKWEKQHWKDYVNKGERKNKDLLKQILIEYRRLDQKVQFIWVRGHAGKEENEICDLLAKLGGKSEITIDDQH